MPNQNPKKKILITGSHGFIGKNIKQKLYELKLFDILEFNKDDSDAVLFEKVKICDVIIHLAGENRPSDSSLYEKTNVVLTEKLCNFSIKANSKKHIIFSSSTQALSDTDYGKSKLSAENLIKNLTNNNLISATVFRFPGIFGKWCKPNYNSVVATFCNNVINGLPLEIHDPLKKISLCYIDDIVFDISNAININDSVYQLRAPSNIYEISLGDLARKIIFFNSQSKTNLIGEVGFGIDRALYSTYLSYLPFNNFSYPLSANSDHRGSFVEFLKTEKSGQVSYFTVKSGATRGQHYHHTKNEKFLVVHGKAKFRFKHILTDEIHDLEVASQNPRIVQSIPGWAHEITNLLDSEMVVLIWANEIFDNNAPDTYFWELE